MIRITLLPIVFFVMIGLLLLIIGLIFSSPQTRRAVLRILGAIILIPAVLFLLLIAVKFKHVKSDSPVPIVISQTTAQVPSVWQDEIEEQFGAEVYSSPQAAAYGLGKLIAEKHKTLLAGQLEIITGAEAHTKAGGPKQIILCEDTADVDMFEHLREGLKQSLWKLEILIQNRTSEGPSEGQVWILLEVQKEPKYVYLREHQDAIANLTGVLRAVIQTPQDKFREQVSYDYRPWIHETSAIQNQYPGQLLMVFSETATDLSTAQKQVYEKACSILIDSISASGRRPIDIQKANLEQFGLVADTYTQQLKGMSAPVWRFALLLDADSEKLNQLVQSTTQAVRHQRSSWVQMGLSLLGMVVIIWIVYSVANAATKGYYSVLLAILAIGAAVVIGVLVFLA